MRFCDDVFVLRGFELFGGFLLSRSVKVFEIKIGHFCQDKGDFLKQGTFSRSAETFEDLGNTFSWSK